MSELFFFKGDNNILLDEESEDVSLKLIKDEISKVIDSKGLSFLLGAGCSSFKNSKEEEVGIPTMSELAREFYNEENVDNQEMLTSEEIEFLGNELKISIDSEFLNSNLERFLELLYSLRFYYSHTIKEVEPDKSEDKNGSEEMNSIFEKVELLIQKTKFYLLKRCLNIDNEGKDQALRMIYEKFYRTLLYRNSSLNRIYIVTTNYDLYSELALDNIGIHFFNGFSGGIKRYFNPTTFNYALSEKMDISHNKWSVVENFIYLVKLHGSINWIEDSDSSKLFNIMEIQHPTIETYSESEPFLIYPSPLKQNSGLGSPYSDLYREFQKNIMQKNNILVVLGYSFNDEHINNLIYQAFAIPSFRMVLFGQHKNPNIKRLLDLNDPRIWIIGGKLEEGSNLHYFKNVVENILPDLSNEEIDGKIENAIKSLFKPDEL